MNGARTRQRHLLAAIAAAGSVAAVAVPAAGAAPVSRGPNLIVNGGAELGAAAGSGYDTVTIPGWQIAGLPTVVRYGQHADGVFGTAGLPRGLNGAGQFPTVHTPGPAKRGRQLFVGGPVGSDTLTQTSSLVSAATAIDAGGVRYTLSGWLGGNRSNASAASVTITFLGGGGNRLASATIGPVTAQARHLGTELLHRAAGGRVPKRARAVRIALRMTDATRNNDYLSDSYNNAYADTLSLHISARVQAPPAPTPPPSRVGRLDHVFMVFMENEGVRDIVGNPLAPYENRLIAHHGFATEYHGLEHPSDPNYIGFFGGATFGIDTNCALACTAHARNLADQLDAAHRSWKFYEQTMPSPCFKRTAGASGPLGPYYSPDELPWPYFADLADNPGRCRAHVLPFPHMASDLASARTTANYTWFEADDCNDMEQCGVAAGDKWLAQTVPEILASPAFKRQRSAVFITFDEDYNNKSVNQDNQDQRIPMIVIASPHSGMLAGRVRSSTYYTQYGLLRTVQEALGLPTTLTLNDRYAMPLNGFWPARAVTRRTRLTCTPG